MPALIPGVVYDLKITLIEKNRKNKDMLSVYTDGKFAFTISESNFLSLNLYEGMDISEETVDYVKNTLNFLEAKARAVRFLTMRLRTEKEVRDKLHEIGYDNECTEKVVNELKALGYINDTLYAQKYILVLRGISYVIAFEVLNDWKFDDFKVAKSLLKRKYGKYDINDEKIQKKARSFLMYRGFSISTINEVLRDMAEDADGQDEV